MRRRGLMFINSVEGKLIDVILSQSLTYTTPVLNQYLKLRQGVQAKFQVWGAKGGSRSHSNNAGGVGGYAEGIFIAPIDTDLYITVGQTGAVNTSSYSKNLGGGGKGPSNHMHGGGGSWISIDETLNSRIIVAGGGGSCGASNKPGGYGGGETGETRTDSYARGGGEGGTQTEGGAGYSGTAGGFGQGGTGVSANDGYGGAGGGGWYGGAGTYPDGSGDDDRGGGGGSGFIYNSTYHANSPLDSSLGSSYYLTSGLFKTGSSVTNAQPNGNGKVIITTTEKEVIVDAECNIKLLPNYWLKPVNPGSCYIPTDYIPTGEISKITGKVKLYPCDTTTTGIFGARKTKASNDRICCWLKENTIMVDYGSSRITHPTTYSAGDEIELPAFSRGNTSTSMTTGMKLTIFAVNNGTEVDERMSKCYINKIILWGDNDVKLHEYIPCQVTKQDGSSFYTLCDIVTKKTYVPVGEFTIQKI